MDLKLLKMRCKDSKQHHVMFHELYSVSLLLCIAQNVRFEIPYKVLYFETPFLITFKCYAWVTCGKTKTGTNLFLPLIYSCHLFIPSTNLSLALIYSYLLLQRQIQQIQRNNKSVPHIVAKATATLTHLSTKDKQQNRKMNDKRQ